MEFSTTRRVGTKRKCNFYFLHSSAFSNLFWLGMKPQRYFLIFWFFFSLYVIFYCLPGKNGTERQFLFFLFLGLFQPILAWNEAITVSFNLLNFFSILFWIFSYASGRNWTKRNDNFYFLSLSLFQPILARNDAIMDFYHFFNFYANFFGIFTYASSGNETERRFLFSQFLGLFQPILAWNDAKMVFFDFLIFFFLFFWNFLLPVG